MKSNRLKKWMAAAVALLFGVSIIGWTIKLTYDTMKILFPNDVVLQYISIALYDGGVIHWLTTYIARAKGTAQRGISLLMTALDFLGVIAMVIAGIYLGGQTLADIPSWVGGAVIVVTIIAGTVNAGAIYYYHANAPETLEEIQAQELEDDLNEEAMDQARYQVERKAQQLGYIMANRVTARLKYRLRLPMTEQEAAEWEGETIDAEAYDPAELPPPPAQPETFRSAVKSFFGGKPSRRPYDGTPSKNSTNSPQAQTMEHLAQTTDALHAWQEMPDSSRKRLWCKTCRNEGAPWLTPEPCQHVLTAKPEMMINMEEAMNTLRKLITEQPVTQEAHYPMTDTKPQPTGNVRPLYNEPTYHPVEMGPKPPQA